jgi:hypothetical protein
MAPALPPVAYRVPCAAGRALARAADRLPAWPALAAAAALLAAASPASAQRAARPAPVPTPSQVLGMAVGADRTLADWGQVTRYFAALAGASPRVRVDTLGPTTQGRPLVMATLTSPANMRRLEEIRRAQARLADPRGLSAAEEARLVAAQPAVVMISCNIHATEIGSSQMAMELAHRLATNDTLQRALERVVVLLVPSMNPDGQQMVVDWYRKGLGTPHEGGPLPWLYHHYVGHDNNRDWYMVTQKETRLVTDVLYRRWFPEVFYDVHQQGTEGMRLTLSPYVDPIDPNVDPLIVRGINHVGAEMALALEARGKSGVGDGVTYDLWWHGGARSTPTRHNMVGLLSEAASARIATPVDLKPADLKGHPRGLPRYERRVNFPNPWPGGTWRLRDIMDYELIASEALVRMLAEQRGEYVRNFVGLGRKMVRLGETEGPRAYVIPAGQRDAHAVARLVEVLRLGGVEVSRAAEPFAAGGRQYAAGSYVVPMAQPYRAHAKDLLEPQRFPKQEQYPGGPEVPPYDVAGWTLPYQLGVRADAIDSAVAARGTPVQAVGAEPPAAHCPAGAGAALDAANTGCYATAFAALRRGQPVTLEARGRRHTVAALPRVALYRPWTASMDEGWTRWVLEQYGAPYANVTDADVRGGKLADYDVLVVPDMTPREMRAGMSERRVPAEYAGGLGDAGVAAVRAFVQNGGRLVLLDRASGFAEQELGMAVRLTPSAARGGEDGGGGAAPAARDRAPGAPAGAATAGTATAGAATAGRPDSAGARGDAERPYAPGSILRVLVDASHPVATGMPDTAAVYFTNSVTLDVGAVPGARVIARYPARADDVLLSGYLSGGAAIAGKAAAADAPFGRGRVVMFGFRPQYRGQSVGTFRLLFNALLAPAGAQAGVPAGR